MKDSAESRRCKAGKLFPGIRGSAAVAEGDAPARLCPYPQSGPLHRAI